MKWVIEENFENIANFLGKLFETTPEEISKRFVDIPVMYLLKFVDEDKDDKILGTLVGVKDEVAPTIMELLYIAFLPDANLEKLNAFYKLINFCKMEFIEAIYGFNISENSFVHIDLEKLPDEIMIHKKMNLLLTRENYKKKWYDLEQQNLVKEKHDFLKFYKYFRLKKGRKSKEFRLKPLHEVTTDKIARLMNKVYSNVDYTDNIVMLSKNYSSYNISVMMKLISGYYGRLSNTCSLMVENNKGELVAYLINMEPQDKKGTIIDLAVDPEYRGMGLGKLLFRNAILKLMEEKQCDSVSFKVSVDNEVPKVLFLKNGFEIVGKEEKEGFLFID